MRLWGDCRPISGNGPGGWRWAVPLSYSKKVARNCSLWLNPAMTPLAATRQRRMVGVLGLVGLLVALAPLASPAWVSGVSLVIGDSTAKPVQHGVGKLKLALQQKGVSLEEAASFRAANGDTVVVAGLASGPGEAARLISELRLTPNPAPDAPL